MLYFQFCVMVETIKVPTDVNFLNEWVDFELPRGIVNKGITGCGATTLAIEDEHKTVICSPRKKQVPTT